MNSEVITTILINDGALVVVDCLAGVQSGTEIAVRKTLTERIKPVLVITQVDRAVTGRFLDKEDLYRSFKSTIDDMNVLLSSNRDPALGDARIRPEDGTVSFGSGLQGWAFTLRQFATRYSKKFGVSQNKLMAKLWGDNYFNSKTKKWTTEGVDGDG